MGLPSTIAHERDGTGDELQLVVVEQDSVTAHPLPNRGQVLVGRGADVDVSLTDPGASAQHSRIYVDGSSVTIEDLGSRNGTQVRDQRLTAGERVPLALGEAVMIAGAVLLVQRKNRRLNQRRSLPHGYFELRLAEECQRAEGNTPLGEFSVARLDVEGELTSEEFAELAAEHLRPTDILGTYARNAYEILLLGASSEAAFESLCKTLDERHAKPRVSVAKFPSDGRSAHALIAKACAGLRRDPQVGSRPGIIVRDERMRNVYRLAEKAAARDINVLILGETGVGKEILAETIHRASKRAGAPFLCLNCGGLNESLRESELFGYERGAFTDAKNAKPGLLEAADGGTVFLDEIGEMSSAVQAMLLRAIETKQVMRVGGLQPKSIDVRFVAATHRDLVQDMKEKRFRSDLYYRLNGITLEIPPLRERRSEIRPLAEAFLLQLAPNSGMSIIPRLSDAAASLLESHSWDGNIRELRNVIDRALLLSDGGDIEPEHLPIETIKSAAAIDDADTVLLDDLRNDPSAGNLTLVERAERAQVIEALRLEGGNQTRAARRLGISRSTLVLRINTFNLPRPNKRS
ncbi:MAG TPA: sigma 54-interacting transcriptional regulator [Polyangiaceae bacterium]|nr:sigma 54-interacting transcriptional regulator [Polyangiaceae bacterium]